MRTIFLMGCVFLAACGPNYTAVNNRLRAENSQQEKEIATLKAKQASDAAIIQSLQDQLSGKVPRVETLPPERLAELFTVGSVQIQKESGSTDLGTGDGKLKGFRIFIRTLTADGMVLPATGKLEVEAFDLPPAPDQPVRIGTWTFSAEEMKKNWYAGLGLNHFAFNLPWETPPRHADVTFKVRFTEALTGNVFTAHLEKKVTLPGGS